MMIHHTTLLLCVAWALLIYNEKQVWCGIVVVSSSSSESGTYCDGLHCPLGSNCMVSINVINGNKTSDKRCSNIYGEVVRQETITVSNGKMCIKNLTMTEEKVNVEQSCRNLSKAETDYMEQEKNNQKILEAVQAKLEQKWHELQRGIKEKTENIQRAMEMQAHALEQANKARAEELETRLAEMRRQLKAKFG